MEGNKSNDLRNNCCNVLTIDAFESVGSLEGYGGYGEPVDWPQLEAQSRNSNSGCPKVIPEDCEEETEGVQSKERWAYVKVNMDGVVIGRKICVLDLAGYSSLALQLEDMFGTHPKFHELHKLLLVYYLYLYISKMSNNLCIKICSR